jgi:hypothetical protein
MRRGGPETARSSSVVRPHYECSAKAGIHVPQSCLDGIELDAYRAEQAAAVVDEVIHGDCLEVRGSIGFPPGCII